MMSSSYFKEMAATAGVIFILIGICRGAAEVSVAPSEPEADYKQSPDSRWYRLQTVPQTWEAAEQTCTQEGGHLAVIESVEESNYLTKVMLDSLGDSNSPTVLLGFSKAMDGKFTTVLGASLEDTGFQRWSNTGPEYLGLKGGNCGSLHRDGGLSRISCHRPAPFICERDNNNVTAFSATTARATTTMQTTTTTVPPQPAPGYEYFTELGWYKVYPKKKWHEALKVCQDEGTHLAVLNSEREASALTRLMNRQRGRIDYGICNCAFIGFHDLSHEGHFITVFGKPLESTGYLKWNYGNPDNTGNNEDCGAITYHGLLNDLSCVEEYPFICESSDDTVLYNPSVNENVTQYLSTYESFPGLGSYKLHTAGKRWHEAIDVCEKEGAYLAIVNSDQESDVLRKIIGRNPDLELGDNNNAVYLGFHDIAKKDDFTTIFGEPLNTTGFTKWAPKLKTNFDCGALNRNGRLYLLNCFGKAPFICEKLEDDDPRKGDTQRKPDSSQDYEFHATLGYYKLYLQKAFWFVAKKKCEQDGAHLAIINSEEESKLLRDIAAKNPDIKLHTSILLGFHDISTEGQFVTIFGTPLESTGYSNWREWNPDNFGGGEDCGAMDHNGFLNDVPCDLELPFFCERDLNTTGDKNAYEGARRMTITPEHMHVRQGAQVSIMCVAPTQIHTCEFTMSNRMGIMDLSRGMASKTNSSLLDSDVRNYRYNGSGLENGQCGIVLTLGSGLHRAMVGCRGYGVQGGWFYAYMSLQASNAPAMRNIESPPEEIISFENQPIKLVWKTASPLTTCKCIFPNEGTEVILSDPFASEEEDDYYDSSEEMKMFSVNKIDSTSFYRGVQYNGEGYKNNQCGLQFMSKKGWNGYLWCGLGSQLAFEWRSVAIIVVKPPSPPVLELNAIEHSEGAMLEAECIVSGSRPMPNITWYLGEEVIRQDLLDDSRSSTWTWAADEQIITQKISRRLKTEDRGKELICEAVNPYSPDEPVRTKKLINMGGSILNRTFDIEEHGFEVGKPGFILITVMANPKPELIWHFDNITIQGGTQDPSGRFVASMASKSSALNIVWVAKLYISNVTEEDFSRDFYLTAKNAFGAQAYRVVIVETKTTVAPTTQPTTQTTTTASTTQSTTTTWSTSGPLETTAAATTGMETTSGYSDYYEMTAGISNNETEEPVFEGNAVPSASSSWSTGGAIAGIVVAILIVHLSLAAILIYGRRVGWSFIPLKARRHFGPAISMDRLVDEDDLTH